MSIQTSFSNSVFKAYKDLVTFGSMESAMYERYTDIEKKDENKNKKKPMSTVMIIFLIILLIIIITIGLIALTSSGFNPFFLFINN